VILLASNTSPLSLQRLLVLVMTSWSRHEFWFTP
jgi:hypothetical protein